MADSIKEPVVPSNHKKLKEFCSNKIADNFNFNIPISEANYMENILV